MLGGVCVKLSPQTFLTGLEFFSPSDKCYWAAPLWFSMEVMEDPKISTVDLCRKAPLHRGAAFRDLAWDASGASSWEVFLRADPEHTGELTVLIWLENTSVSILVEGVRMVWVVSQCPGVCRCSFSGHLYLNLLVFVATFMIFWMLVFPRNFSLLFSTMQITSLLCFYIISL